LLHLDEASFSFSDEDIDSSKRIPFDILISLYDRMPCEVEKQAGDFALISLRVRELYDAAKKWQDEITRDTTISFRGGKRRAVGSPGSVDPDQEASSKLQMEQMKKLAENPILTKVSVHRVPPKPITTNLLLKMMFDVSLDCKGCHAQGKGCERDS
jgi:hypothetical protein